MFPNLLFVRLDEDCLLRSTSSELVGRLSEVKFYIPRSPLPQLLNAHCIFLFGNDNAGHALGVAASWLVQVGIEIYRYISEKIKSEEDNIVNKTEKLVLLRKKIASATLRCSSSLVFASIGAGIGATLFRPSAGQWIGKFTPL